MFPLQDRTGLLLFVHGMTVFLALLQFIGVIVILVYGVEESVTLTNELNDVFMKLIYDWDVDPKAAEVMKQIMEYVSTGRGIQNYIKCYPNCER
jgi:hypothetical protein